MGTVMLVFAVVVLLFGAKRLPEIGSSLGKAVRGFKSSIGDIGGEREVRDEKPKVSRAPNPQEE